MSTCQTAVPFCSDYNEDMQKIKKGIAIGLSLWMIFMLAGCQTQSTAQSTPENTQTLSDKDKLKT
jgi:uncharacterized lipoprotein YajG